MKKIFIILTILLISGIWLQAQQRYVVPCGKEMLKLSKRYALSQIGVTIKKNPDRVREYLLSAGVKSFPAAFCQSGQRWTFCKAQEEIIQFNKDYNTDYDTYNPIPKSGLANSTFWAFKKNGKQTKYIAKVDDMLIWYRAKTPFGHIERIIAILKGGWVETIAFNTDNGQVKKKKRNYLHPIGRLLIRGLAGFND